MANDVNLSPQSIRELTNSLERSLQGAFTRTNRPTNQSNRTQSSNSLREAELSYNELVKRQKELGKVIQLLTKELDKATGDYAKSLREALKTNEEEYKHIEENIKIREVEIRVLRSSSSRVEEFGKTVASSSKKIASATTKYIADTIKWNRDLGKGVDQVIEDYRKSLSAGLSVDYITSMTLGLTQEAFLEISREHRRTMEAFNKEGRVFTERMGEMSRSLLFYTGSLEKANKMAAVLETTSRNLGLYGDAASEYANELSETFKRFNSSLSMTDNEFTNLINNIHSDNEVRTISARLAGTERKEFSQGINRLVEYFGTLGYSSDQIANLTREFIKTFKKDDPKERFKDIMKEVALGGAMGLSQSELDFRLRTATMSPSELQRYAPEIAEYQQKIGSRLGVMQEGSFSQQLVGSRLQQRLGNDMITQGQLHTMQREAMGGGLDLDDRGGERDDTTKTLFEYLERITNMLGNAPAMIATAILSAMAGSAFRGGYGRGGRGGFGGLGDIFGGRRGNRGRDGGRGGSRGRGFGVGGAVGPLSLAYGAYQLGQTDFNDGREITNVVGSTAGAWGGGKAGAAIGSLFVPGIGTLVGGIAGSVIGAYLGSGLTDKVYEKFSKSVEDSNRIEEKRLRMLEKYSDSAYALERASELAYGAAKYSDMRNDIANPSSPSHKTEQLIQSREEIARRRDGEELFREAFNRQAFSNRLTSVDGFKVREAYESYGAGEKEMAMVAKKIAQERMELSEKETEKFVKQIVSGLLQGKRFTGELVSFGADMTSSEIEVLKMMFEEFKSMNEKMEKMAKIAQEERDREILQETDTSVVSALERVAKRMGRSGIGPNMG